MATVPQLNVIRAFEIYRGGEIHLGSAKVFLGVSVLNLLEELEHFNKNSKTVKIKAAEISTSSKLSLQFSYCFPDTTEQPCMLIHHNTLNQVDRIILYNRRDFDVLGFYQRSQFVATNKEQSKYCVSYDLNGMTIGVKETSESFDISVIKAPASLEPFELGNLAPLIDNTVKMSKNSVQDGMRMYQKYLERHQTTYEQVRPRTLDEQLVVAEKYKKHTQAQLQELNKEKGQYTSELAHVNSLVEDARILYEKYRAEIILEQSAGNIKPFVGDLFTINHRIPTGRYYSFYDEGYDSYHIRTEADERAVDSMAGSISQRLGKKYTYDKVVGARVAHIPYSRLVEGFEKNPTYERLMALLDNYSKTKARFDGIKDKISLLEKKLVEVNTVINTYELNLQKLNARYGV